MSETHSQDHAQDRQDAVDMSRAAALIPARTDAIGTSRRLQGLIAIGHSETVIASVLGLDQPTLAPILRGQQSEVSTKTAAAVRDLFSLLWMHPVPGSAGARSRALAKANRWVSPLAWDDIDDPDARPIKRLAPTRDAGVPDAPGAETDALESDDPNRADRGYVDEIAVDRAVNGERVKLRYPERLRAIQRLHARRWSDNRIARTLRLNPRTVLRNREVLGLPAWELSELDETSWR